MISSKNEKTRKEFEACWSRVADYFLTRQNRRGNQQIQRRSSRVDDADGTEFKDATRLRHFQGSVIRILKQREAPVARGRLVTRKRATIAFVSGRRETNAAENCCCRPACLRKIEKLTTLRRKKKREREREFSGFLCTGVEKTRVAEGRDRDDGATGREMKNRVEKRRGGRCAASR